MHTTNLIVLERPRWWRATGVRQGRGHAGRPAWRKRHITEVDPFMALDAT
jgi:hypothetical protein